MPDEGKSIFRRLAVGSGLFNDDSTPAPEATTGMSAPAGPPPPAPPTFPRPTPPDFPAAAATASAEADILTAEFPDIYSRNGVVGNPQIDPILTAYSQMAGPLKGEGLVTAMKAMMQGMGVPETTVIETLTKRLAVLAQTWSEANAKAADRKTERDQALATLKAKCEARIAELQAEIAKLEQMLGDKGKEVADADAGDFGAMKGFEVKLTAEQQRIQALKTFLERGATA